MNWSVYAIATYPGDLWSDWQHLANAGHAGNPMLDEEFAKLLVQNFGQSRRLHVLVGCVAHEVTALAIVQPVSVGRWCTFKPSQAQIALLVNETGMCVDWKSILGAFPGICWRFDLFALDPVEHCAFLTPTADSELRLASRDICIEVSEDFDAYWEGRPRKLKNNIRRYRNRLEKAGVQVMLQVASTPDEVSTATDRYGILESRGWKGRRGTALHPGNKQGRFYRLFMSAMASRSRAFVFELHMADALVGSRLCVVGDERLVTLKTTYDETLKHYAIGRLHLYSVLEYIFEKKLASTVDFYTNASDDQMSWATSSRSMMHRTAYRSGFVKSLFNAAKSLKNIASLK